MNHEDYLMAADYWKKKDADGIKVTQDKLQESIEQYIKNNNTCTLATGSGDFVRCTPIEYSYFDGCLWMFSEGGMKFYALEKNKNVCIAIYDKYDGFGSLKGMQIMGRAKIVEPFSDTYVKAANYKKIPIEALKKLSSPMHLICVEPLQVDYLNSEFKKEGFSSRQHLEWH